MADQMETVLRNALDAVDRGRRWAMLGVAALAIAAVVALAALFATAASRVEPATTAGLTKTLFVGFVAQMLLTACCTAIVMMHTTRTAKSILRAIEVKRSGGNGSPGN